MGEGSRDTGPTVTTLKLIKMSHRNMNEKLVQKKKKLVTDHNSVIKKNQSLILVIHHFHE